MATDFSGRYGSENRSENNSEADNIEDVEVERMAVFDEYRAAVGEKYFGKFCEQNLDIPEGSPFWDWYGKAKKQQYNLFKEQIEDHPLTLPEYRENIEAPDNHSVIDLDRLESEGLWISDNIGLLKVDREDHFDDDLLTVGQDFDLDAIFSEDSDTEETAEGSALTDLEGIGQKKAESLEDAGFESPSDLDGITEEQVEDLRGITVSLMERNGIEVVTVEDSEPEEDEEAAEGSEDSTTEGSDEMGEQIAAYLEANPEVALEALKNAL